MYNLLKIEFMKLRKSKEFWYIFLGTCLISIGLVCNDVYNMELFIKKMSLEYSINGLSVYMEGVNGKLYIGILQSIIVIIFICKDFEKKIVQSEYLAGYSRFEILMSKVIICIVINIILEFFFIFIRTIGTSSLYGLGESLTFTLVLKMLKIYLLSTLIRFSITSSAIMIAYIFKTISVSILVWLGVFLGYLIGLEVLTEVFNSEQYLKYLANNSIFQFYNMLKLDMIPQDIIYIISRSSLRIFVVLIITYLIFRKTELR